eukprot:8118638-Pyramimonas_sp.AAC.1
MDQERAQGAKLQPQEMFCELLHSSSPLLVPLGGILNTIPSLEDSIQCDASRSMIRVISPKLYKLPGITSTHPVHKPSLTRTLRISPLRTQVRPRNAWQIDPFGHGGISRSLFIQLGFESVVLNRVPDEEKQRMKAAKDLEFFWLDGPSSEINNDTDRLFVHVLDSHYSTPPMEGRRVRAHTGLTLQHPANGQ